MVSFSQVFGPRLTQRNSNEQRLHPGSNGRCLLHCDQAETIAALEIDPELRLHAEEGAECEGDFRIDGALAFDDLIDCGTRNPGAPGKFVLAELISIEKFLFKHNAFRDWKIFHQVSPSRQGLQRVARG